MAPQWRLPVCGSAGENPTANDVLHTFTIVTGLPNDLVSPIHNRMPVILLREAWHRWLGEEEAGADELLALLRPYPADLLRAYPVGQRVGNVKNNDPALLDPVVLAA